MSNQQSLMADNDEDFIRKTMYIMLVWLVVVVAAGVVLLLFRDPLASLFAISGFGL